MSNNQIKVRKTPSGFSVQMKLPMPAITRRAAEAQFEPLRRSVFPIIGARPRRTAPEQLVPFVVASAVLIEAGDRKLFATAAHVLSDNVDVPFYHFGPDGLTREIGGAFQVSEVADLAIKWLSDREAEAFGHLAFIDARLIGPVSPVGERFYAGVIGFPAAQAKRLDWVTIDPRMSCLFDAAVELPNGRIKVAFDKKGGMVQGGVHITPPSPDGMSGGAIFGMPLSGITPDPEATPNLVGMTTRWPRRAKHIEGEGSQHLLRLIDTLA